MNSPTISVLTITRNNKAELQKTVASVLAQDYEKIEFIVVDGASNDGTPEYLASLRRDNFKWISEPDRGIPDAFNKAMGLASGDTVIFMNSGDSFADARTLSEAMGLVPTEVNVRESVVYGDYYQVLESESYYHRTDHQDMNTVNNINNQSAFIGSELCRRYKYDERWILAMDYDHWLRMLSAQVPFIKIDRAIARFEATGISSSPKYQVHRVLMRFFCVALNTKRRLTIRDAFVLFYRAMRMYLEVCFRSVVGRPLIRAVKGILIRLGIKSAPK